MRLELWQASMRFTVHPRQARDDTVAVLRHAPDVVGFTEATSFHDQLRSACREHGYHLMVPHQDDTAIAVWGGHKMVDTDYVAVVPAGHHPPHTPRGVASVTIRPSSQPREVVSACVAHWLTERVDTADQDQRVALTEAMAESVRHLAAGRRVAFWLGDTNNPDRPSSFSSVDKALRKGDLTSCWDELGRYPDTHGDHTLDVVGSYDPDRRVTCLRARHWPRMSSDHRPVSAVYDVRTQQRA